MGFSPSSFKQLFATFTRYSVLLSVLSSVPGKVVRAKSSGGFASTFEQLASPDDALSPEHEADVR